MLKNRTLIGIILIVAAIGLCFGISPLFNTILASKTTIIRLKQDIKIIKSPSHFWMSVFLQYKNYIKKRR